MIRPDRFPRDSSGLAKAFSHRESLSRKQDSRRELDQFFCDCIRYLERSASERSTNDSLSDTVAAFAFHKFGTLASCVLRHWGINSPEELEQSFCEYLRACGSHGSRRTAGFSQSEALKALFRGDYWPRR